MGVYTRCMASPTAIACSLPLLKAKMDGPEPEIPDPNAPCFRAASFTSLKPGISTLRIGSTITSSSERAIKFIILFI